MMKQSAGILGVLIFLMSLGLINPDAPTAAAEWKCKLTDETYHEPLDGEDFAGDAEKFDDCCCPYEDPEDKICCEVWFGDVGQTGGGTCNHYIKRYTYTCYGPTPPPSADIPCGSTHIAAEYWKDTNCNQIPNSREEPHIDCPTCPGIWEISELDCLFYVWQDIIDRWHGGAHIPSHSKITCCPGKC